MMDIMHWRTNSLWFAVLLLGGILIFASLDKVPDPPAVQPHGMDASSKISCPKPQLSGAPELHFDCEILALRPVSKPPLIVFALTREARRPADWIRLTGHASDPSPPVRSRWV